MMIGLIALTGCASQRLSMRHPSAERQPQHQPQHQKVHFDFDQAKIRNEDKPLLNRVASRLHSDRKSMVLVEGHTDKIGSRRYNEILAENRARAVRVYLRDQGADARRITMTSKGSREPLVKGRGRAQLQPNRRVEIIMNLTREGF